MEQEEVHEKCMRDWQARALCIPCGAACDQLFCLGLHSEAAIANLGLAIIFGISWFHINIPSQKLFFPSELSRAGNCFCKDLDSQIPSYSTNTFNLHLSLQKTGLTHLWNLSVFTGTSF